MTDRRPTDADTVADTVAMLADRQAISDLVVAYASAVDRRDWAGVAACFAPDAFVSGTRMQGPFADYLPFMRAQLEAFDRTTHHVSNHRARVDGDSAWAETYTVALHLWTTEDGALRRMAVSVRYEDTLERRGEWRIVNRAVSADWLFEDPPHAGGLPWTLPAPGEPIAR